MNTSIILNRKESTKKSETKESLVNSRTQMTGKNIQAKGKISFFDTDTDSTYNVK